jgi:Fe-S-cluster containining protein
MWQGERILRRKADPIFGRACKFLDPELRRCTIYEGRPSTCREFPAQTRCAYYDLLQFERVQQGDDTVLPLVQITFRDNE